MKQACLIGCALLSILLISPVTTYAGNCPQGQKENDRTGECVKDTTSSSKKTGEKTNLSKGVVSTDVNFILREDQGIISSREPSGPNHKKPYGYQVVTKPFPVREGEYAERFEVRPGDCGEDRKGGVLVHSDCATSRERWEIHEFRNKPGKSDPYSKGKAWYTFSIFFPQDYPIIAPTAVTHVQWKEIPRGGGSIDSFHFRFTGQERLLRLTVTPEFVSGVDTTKECKTQEENETKDICKNLVAHETFLIPEEELRGNWHDFTVFINWSTDPDKGYAKVCLNGAFATEWFGRTRFFEDSITTLRYGIYRGYLYQYYEQHGVDKAPAQVVFFDRVAKHKGEPPDDVKACLERTTAVATVKAHVVQKDFSSKWVYRHISLNYMKKSIQFGLLAFGKPKPTNAQLMFDHHTLPSIDLEKIKEEGCGPKWMYFEKKNKRRITLAFQGAYMSQLGCIFKTLSEDDKDTVKLIVKNIDEIVRQISEGQSDAWRWEKLASIIKRNAHWVPGLDNL